VVGLIEVEGVPETERERRGDDEGTLVADGSIERVGSSENRSGLFVGESTGECVGSKVIVGAFDGESVSSEVCDGSMDTDGATVGLLTV